MSVVQRAVLDTQSNKTLAERLIDQLANRIGGLGVELADIAGNVQEVASRVANQSERFHHLQKTAQTMVSANRDIANASQAVQSTTSAAVVEIVQSRSAVDTAVKHIAELVEAVGRIETRLSAVGSACRRLQKFPARSRRLRSRLTCWRSMPRSRRRAPELPAAALPWSRAK